MTASAPEARPLHAGEKNRHPDGKSRHSDEKKCRAVRKKCPSPATRREHRADAPAGAFRGTEGPACAE